MPNTLWTIRQAVRRLLRASALTSVSVLTLAVGIAAVITVFSLVDGVLLNPLPYPEANRLVALRHDAPGLDAEGIPLSPPLYLMYASKCRSLESVALFQELQLNLTGQAEPERLAAAAVTSSLFRMLRVSPALGRAFSSTDEAPGAPAVAILSDGLWRRRYGADRQILGRTVRLDGREATVVGVMSSDFWFLRPRIDLWRPLGVDPLRNELGQLQFYGYGRLAPGVTIDQAESELDGLLSGLPGTFPGDDTARLLTDSGFAARVYPLREEVVGRVERLLWILLCATGLILVIAVVNVSSLLLVRSENRQRERAIELALGASPRQIAGSILAESLILSLAAGSLALLLAVGALRVVLHFRPSYLPRLHEVGIDGSVLLFALAVSLLTSLLAGLFPALRARGRDLGAHLREGSLALAGSARKGRRLRLVLVSFQIALAHVLMIGSGLLLRSFLEVAGSNPGFDPGNLLVVEVTLPEERYPDDESAERVAEEIVARLGSLPGVTRVAVSSAAPFSGRDEGAGHEIEESSQPADAPPLILQREMVSAGYFETLGIPLLAGRGLEPADLQHRTGNVVINRTVAGRLWPGESALGKRLRPGPAKPDAPWYTVVGVVGDIHHRGQTEPARPTIYYPLLGRRKDAWTVRQMSIVARTSGASQVLMATSRQRLREIDRVLVVERMSTMEEQIRRSNSGLSFTVLVLTAGTAIAVLLSAVGLYAFVSTLVSRQTAEIGIRMAMGASPGRIRWMVLREGLATAVAGAVLGVAGAVAATSFLRALLFGVSPLDPLTFVAVPVFLLLLALLAAQVPAGHAARIDPVRTLATGI